MVARKTQAESGYKRFVIDPEWIRDPRHMVEMRAQRYPLQLRDLAIPKEVRTSSEMMVLAHMMSGEV